MKRRSWQLIVVVSLLIFLVSCGPRPNAGDEPLGTQAAIEAASTGIQGVETTLLPNYPPNIIYDSNELLAIVEVKNKGNFNLEPQDCFVEITGFDPNIIKGFRSLQSCAVNLGTLEGKNVYNTKGMSNQIEFLSPDVRLPSGVYEYSPQMKIITCYRYTTTANPAVCVDPAFYQVTSEQKSCRPQNVMMGSGQGGPVGISYVGVDMVGSRAIFEINVKNFGSGTVLSPVGVDIQSCGQDSLRYQDLNDVGYTVRTTSGRLSCRPSDGIVRLNDNQGKIICNYETSASTAFETPIQIQLDYNYIDSFSKNLKIIQTPE